MYLCTSPLARCAARIRNIRSVAIQLTAFIMISFISLSVMCRYSRFHRMSEISCRRGQIKWDRTEMLSSPTLLLHLIVGIDAGSMATNLFLHNA
jgi:hypothetical protein